MNGLERELRGLAAVVEWPPTPDVGAVVRSRLGTASPSRTPWWRRRAALAVAVATLVAALAAVLAVPQTRAAVLRWFGIGSVEIVRVDELPEVVEATPLPGRLVSLAEARRSVPYELLSPAAGLGPPDEIRLLDDPPIVTFVWREDGRARLAISQLPGTTERPLIEKLVGPGTRVEEFTEAGRPAVWLEGDGHDVFILDPTRSEPYADRARLAGNTLLVVRGGMTIRVEGDLTRSQALEIVRTLD